MSGDGLPQALSFDDVILLPGRSRVEPWQVDISTKASRRTSIRIPLIAAPMDTVSEWRLAVSLALLGGVAVIHRNMSREEQLNHVEKVKRHPKVKLAELYVEAGDECCRVVEYMRSLGLRNLPLVSGGRPVGTVRFTDLAGCRCGERVEKYARGEAVYPIDALREALEVLRGGRYDTVALTGEGGVFLGTVVFDEALRDYQPAVDSEGRLLVAAAVSPFDVERVKMLDGVADILVIDVAHFHNDNVMNAVRRFAKDLVSDLVVGNIGTSEAVVDAFSIVERVDGLRVGIAGGNICTTSGVAGVAAPTLYAVMMARRGLEEVGVDPGEVPIIADGGIRGSGDAVKALAAGASAVMSGYMLAGTDEAAAPLIRVGGRAYKPYRGMASRGAMERRFAVDRYSRVAKRVEEGIEGLVPYRGPLEKVVAEFVEGVKAGLGYAGAASIEELWRVARFARIASRIGAYTGTVKTEA
ncbi:MAG: IMP dehydrogenase [Crenarchaeota archaeon]|nr:IMP dehydrogenase [Thermoproteota archaeon]